MYSQMLRPGGVFFGVAPDADAILHALGEGEGGPSRQLRWVGSGSGVLGLGLGLGLGCVSVGEWRVGWVEWIDTQIVYLVPTGLPIHRPSDPPTLPIQRRGPPEHPFALYLHLLSSLTLTLTP